MKAIHNILSGIKLCQITVSDREDTKLLKAIHNVPANRKPELDTVSDREDTKLLKAIHNDIPNNAVVSKLFQTAKIQNF